MGCIEQCFADKTARDNDALEDFQVSWAACDGNTACQQQVLDALRQRLHTSADMAVACIEQCQQQGEQTGQ